MAKYEDAFGSLVARRLEDAKISAREAARRSRGAISHYTIGDMLKGQVPNSDLIVAFARAVGSDPNELLEAAGIYYLRYVEEPVEAGRETISRKPFRGAVGGSALISAAA